ncbi:MAG: response regulator transcription factor [Trueperaceae bacterium]
MSRASLLLVEDDDRLREMLVHELEAVGYHVVPAADGAAGMEAMIDHGFDLVLLDLNLPDVDGLEVAERIRDEGTPIVMLTARADVDDRVAGLYAGARDYLVKPFDVRELLARVHAQLREGPGAEVLGTDQLRYDPGTRTATGPNGTTVLPEREGDLLRLLLAHRGRVFSVNDLERRLYGPELPESNTVQVYVSSLRRKLAELGAGRPIRTVRGKGYTVA